MVTKDEKEPEKWCIYVITKLKPPGGTCNFFFLLITYFSLLFTESDGCIAILGWCWYSHYGGIWRIGITALLWRALRFWTPFPGVYFTIEWIDNYTNSVSFLYFMNALTLKWNYLQITNLKTFYFYRQYVISYEHLNMLSSTGSGR